jgi:hypothetical protein
MSMSQRCWKEDTLACPKRIRTKKPNHPGLNIYLMKKQIIVLLTTLTLNLAGLQDF